MCIIKSLLTVKGLTISSKLDVDSQYQIYVIESPSPSEHFIPWESALQGQEQPGHHYEHFHGIFKARKSKAHTFIKQINR